VASLKTSPRGYFHYRVPKGPSRIIRFRFAGTQTIQPSIRQVKVLVPARTTIHVDHHHVLNGQYIHLRGLVIGGEIPSTGKLVELQARVRGRWRTFATARTDAGGHWRYEYRFDGTRGHQTYRLRAGLPSEADYPCATGYSRSIAVRVSGL
jgi:hypothetical protein